MNTEALNIYKDKAIINFEGADFQGQLGIDSRIFSVLNGAGVSVGFISQQAIENGISVLVDAQDADAAVESLTKEFAQEIKNGFVENISAVKEITVIGFISGNYQKILTELQRNNIFPYLLNQVAATGRVNLVVASSQTEMAKNIVESEILGKPKAVHLALLGHGNVGGTLIEQILDSSHDLLERKRIDLKIVAISNSRHMVFNKAGFGSEWRQKIKFSSIKNDRSQLIDFAKQNQLENLILVDNTANLEVAKSYPEFASNGFDLVSSNKIFNTLSISKYRHLRSVLEKNRRKYLYETNVGAGLPLIDTIKLLHLSGENITRIKGVFSGSLSYIFNQFSVRDTAFSDVVREAMDLGFTEPDPREDLSGNDVARKLLILARELDLINEFQDIKIQNLIPEKLQALPKEDFIAKMNLLDAHFSKIKDSQQPDHVLRYIGDLHGDLQQEKGELDVQLVSVPKTSALGQLKGSDSIFEIYTESYGENPLVIMGAGAGAKVTARGVFGDILRLSETK